VTRSIRSLQTTGIEGGVWDGDGGPADFPLDQRPDDGSSLCWDSSPLTERVELLGIGEARLEVSADRPVAFVVVRVSDVAPGGAATLVARGFLNLTRREGHDRTVPLAPGEPAHVTVSLQSTGYAIPAGHRIRLAVSNSYWPMVWPSPEPTTLTVHGGEVSLPRRRANELDDQLQPFGPAETGTPLATETTKARGGGRGGGRRVTRNLATGETEVEFDWRPSGARIIDTDTEMAEDNITTYRITQGDPLSAAVSSEVDVSLDRPGWRTRVRATGTMTSDAERFLVTTTLEAFEGNARIFARTYTHVFPRDGV
jgi:predicted acyl esterase